MCEQFGELPVRKNKFLHQSIGRRLNGCFLNWWYPKIIRFNGVYHLNTILFAVLVFLETPVYSRLLVWARQHRSPSSAFSNWYLRPPAVCLLSGSRVPCEICRFVQSWANRFHDVLLVCTEDSNTAKQLDRMRNSVMHQ